MKNHTRQIILFILLVIALYNAIKLIEYREEAKNTIIEIPTTTQPIEVYPPTEPIDHQPIDNDEPQDNCEMISEYTELYERNPEMVGVISIPDTNINYPVLYSPNDPNFYLKHDFDKNESAHGSIFLGKDTIMDSSAVLIYGHYMKDGTMFADLHKFLNEEFFNVHQYLEINSLYELKNYQVIAVFKDYIHMKSDESFKFYNYYGEPEEEQFEEFKEFLESHSIYTRDLEFLTYEDKVAQLVTCSYHVDNGRLVVVCKEV